MPCQYSCQPSEFRMGFHVLVLVPCPKQGKRSFDFCSVFANGKIIFFFFNQLFIMDVPKHLRLEFGGHKRNLDSLLLCPAPKDRWVSRTDKIQKNVIEASVDNKRLGLFIEDNSSSKPDNEESLF